MRYAKTGALHWSIFRQKTPLDSHADKTKAPAREEAGAYKMQLVT
ncbi:hypothetical protein GGD46_005163 [Rhizobium lusitanum]|uniref:Uncharacterized protein n=1 Tax=Rhizobium lusitanum TaxID=293958 RepID=A0A7X0MG99_9HYPH|nr:hypothetical protein [Rhizobium lusitanum]